MTNTASVPLPHIKLGEDNYRSWARQAEAHLGLRQCEGKPLLSAIQVTEGEIVPPAVERQAKYMLALMVDDCHQDIVFEAPTAAAAWTQLESMYRSTVRARKQKLIRENGSLKQGVDETIQMYFLRAKRLCKDMLHAGITVCTDDFVDQVLANAQRRFQTTIRLEQSRLENKGETVDLDSILPALLLEQEDQQASFATEDTVALVVQRPPARNTQGNNFAGGAGANRKFPFKCHYCKITGHKEVDCRKKKRDLANNQVKKPDTAAAAPQRFALVAGSTGNSRSEWLFDTAASLHMTGSRWNMKDFEYFKEPHPIALGDDRRILAAGKGTVELQGVNGAVVAVSDVFYVPDLKYNLFSPGWARQTNRDVNIVPDDIGFHVHVNGHRALTFAQVDTRFVLVQELPPMAAAAVAGSSTNKAQLMHARLGHVNYHTMERMFESGVYKGLDVTKNDIHEAKDVGCTVCIQSKAVRASRAPVTDKPSVEPLEVLHVDLAVPDIEGVEKYKYLMVLSDEATGFLHVAPLRFKSSCADVLIDVCVQLQRQTGRQIRRIRSDNGGEFQASKLRDWCAKQGIKQEFTPPYSPQSNGVAERSVRTIKELTRALRLHSDADPRLWPHFAPTAAYLRNRVPNSKGVIPQRALFPQVDKNGEQTLTDLQHLRIIGSTAFRLKTEPGSKQMMDPKSDPCILVGYGSEHRLYKVWCPSKGKCFTTADVVIRECSPTRMADDTVNVPQPIPNDLGPQQGLMPGAQQGPQQGPQQALPADISGPDTPIFYLPGTGSQISFTDNVLYDTDTPSERAAKMARLAAGEVTQVVPLEDEPSEGQSIQNTTTAEGTSESTSSENVDQSRYPKRTRQAPQEWWKTSASGEAFVASSVDMKLPRTYKEAMKQPDAELWLSSMNEEYASLLQHQTFELVELPTGCVALDTRWVFTHKLDQYGNIQRYKSRLVAKGFQQQEGVDFTDIYAPTAKKDTERVFLSFVAENDLECHQADVKTAFLHGDLNEVVYVRQPDGFHEGGPNMVWRLNKALYGLRQAPRAWYLHLKQVLEGKGFTASQADASFFTLDCEDDRILLLVYVDDILVAAKSLDNVNKAKHMLQAEFDIKDLGEAKVFLGMEIERDRDAGTLKLSQTGYLSNLAARFDATETVPTGVPMTTGFELFPKIPGEQLDKNFFPYQSLLGGLLYASTGTRPDIAYAVSALARVSNCYTQAHVDALLKVLQYAYHTRDIGIVYGVSGNGLVGYCDADYAGDAFNRKSTNGYVFVKTGGAVSWLSRRQDIVAQSTGESEYIAASAAGKQALWLRILESDLTGRVAPVLIFTDNTAALSLLSNPIASKRSKHIDVQYHFARDRVMRGELQYEYCSTNNMWADCLTKAVPKAIMLACREGMGLHE